MSKVIESQKNDKTPRKQKVLPNISEELSSCLGIFSDLFVGFVVSEKFKAFYIV